MSIRSPFSAVGKPERDAPAASVVDYGLGEAYETVEFVKNNIQILFTLAGMTDQLGVIYNNIGNFGNYALVGHLHTGVYAPLEHFHAEYAALVHYHPEYAAADHDHDTEYQPIGNYALAGHNHDERYLRLGDAGVAGGALVLDGAGKIPSGFLPALAITKPNVVASQVAQLALVAEEGDVAIRTDLKRNYIHNGGTSGTMADWTILENATDLVTSVNGYMGTVVLAKGDIGLGNVDNTADMNKPVSTAQAAYVTAAVAAIDVEERARDAVGTALVASTGLAKVVDDAADTITLSIDTAAEAERIRDVIGAALVAGTNITLVVNDAGDTITINGAATSTAYTDEMAQDAVAGMLVAGANITLTYNDAANTLTIASTASGGSTAAYRGAFGVATDSTTYTWSAAVNPYALPSGWSINSGVMAVVAEADATLATSHALTFDPAASLGNNAFRELTMVFTVTVAGVAKVRYRTQGEQNFDGTLIFIDGSQVSAVRQADSGFIEYTSASLAAGSHTMVVRYSSDGSATAGYQNVRISRIVLPVSVASTAYAYGDIVTNNGKKYICLVAGTLQTPNTASTEWAVLERTLVAGTNVTIVEDANSNVTISASGGGSSGNSTISDSALVNTTQGSNSTTYVDLATAGPSVTMTTGTDALVMISANVYRDAAGNTGIVSIEVSGATTIAASDANSVSVSSPGGGYNMNMSKLIKITGLTPGVNTFKMKYRCDGGTGWNWSNRVIAVVNPTTFANTDYSLPIGVIAAPSASEVLLVHSFAQAVTFPDDFAGAQKIVGTNPVATFALDIQKSTAGGAFASVGSISVSNAGAVTFLTTGTTVSFAIGDAMKVVAQAGVDTLANSAFTLKGTKA